MDTRPLDFECPWCGPNGVAINRALPANLQLCDDCQRESTLVPIKPDPALELHKEQLRKILTQHVLDFGKRWPGCDFGKAIVGNSILGAMSDLGMDTIEELTKVVAYKKHKFDYILGLPKE
jgi:hypothetical protein